MALGISTGKMKEMVEKTISTNMKVIELQSRFAEDMIKRNTAAMFEVADARIGHLQDLTHIKSFTDLYENTLEVEGNMRDKFVNLYQDNTQSAKDFGEELKNVLEINDMIARMKSFSESVGSKVKSASDTTVTKAKDISDSTVTRVKTLTDGMVSKVRSPATPANPGKKAPAARKPAAKKAPSATPATT